MARAIKYEDTTVEASRSADQLKGVVRRYGGVRFEELWDEGQQVAGIRFAVRRAADGREVPVVLDVPLAGIEQRLREAGKYRDPVRRREQARRIAWRHMKDWVEQSLLAADVGLFDVWDVFLAKVEAETEAGERVPLGRLLAAMLEAGREGQPVHLLPPPRRLLPGPGQSSPAT